MSKNKLIILIALLAAAATISGCSISFKGSEGGGRDGGVYKTVSRGDKWIQKVLIPTTSGRAKSFGSVSANALAIDPSDNKAIYMGSVENGLFYTYDGANDWQIANKLGKITINAVAIDYDSKCIIYAASGNKVYKSTDCNRTWSQVYFDNDLKVKINAIAVDHYETANVYIGTSRGEVVKSSDRGNSWQTVGRFQNNVKKIVISPHDSRIIFAATAKKGIHRSVDGGKSWVDLSEKLKEFKESKSFRDLEASSAQSGLVILATNYGLLKSVNNGDEWSKIELITPEKKATINTIALGPKNAKEIYYATATTFYRSLDGGATWTTKKLPTARAGWRLLIDSKDPSVLYMGVKKLKK